jgi:UDP-glucose 4-epimerase
MGDNRVVLITGAGGFLGTHIAREFSLAGCRVVGVGKSEAGAAARQYLHAYHRMTLPDPALKAVFAEHAPSVCIHCAGGSSVPLSFENPRSDFYAGPLSTFELLETLRQVRPECRTVFLSSAAVYGDPQTLPIGEDQTASPISPYGFHKLECEQLCFEYAKLHGMRTASVRVFSAYGSGLRKQVVWDMCEKAVRNGSLSLRGSGGESRDFVHGEDVAKAVRLVVEKAPCHGEPYNVGSGRETTIVELAELVAEALQLRCKPIFDGTVSPGTPRNWRADIGRISVLGFQPSITFAQGISSFANWCRGELS